MLPGLSMNYNRLSLWSSVIGFDAFKMSYHEIKNVKKCVNNEYFCGIIGCIRWSTLNHSDSYRDRQGFITLQVSLVWIFVNNTYLMIQRSFGVWASVNTNRASIIRQHVYVNMDAVLIYKKQIITDRPTHLTHWTPLHNIACEHPCTVWLFKFHGCIYTISLNMNNIIGSGTLDHCTFAKYIIDRGNVLD